jgi:hypothetical protein
MSKQPKVKKNKAIDFLPTDPFGVIRSTKPHMAIVLAISNIVQAY